MGTKLPVVEVPTDLPHLCVATAEHAPLPMATVDGATHIVRYVNPAFCRLMGEPAEQLVGRPLQELLPEKDECMTLLDRVLLTGRPERHTELDEAKPHPVFWSYTMWPVTAHESLVGIMIQVTETAYTHQATVAINEALVIGSVRQHELTAAAESLNAQLRDEISQRQQAEEALRESEGRFRSLFTSVPMASCACDRDAIIQQYNSRAVELWGREPVCGVDQFCGSLRLWLPDGRRLLHADSPMVEVLRTGVASLNVEVSIERPDGTRVPVLANFAALKSGDGTIFGTITSFMDLTERKKLEQQSLRVQRMESLGTLAGGIAHDLNNSLGPIMMSLELLRMKFTDPASQDLLAIIDTSAQRGAEMVRQVLSFAHGVEGRRAAIQVPLLVRGIAKIVNESFPRNTQIRTSIPPELWTMLGDSSQLHQVLLNLCLNARDAMPNGGVIVVSAENRQIDAASASLSQNPKARPGPYVVLEVKDAGTGMPPEIVDNIFDPFFTTKEFGKGSGLGLSTALAIVKSHGGLVHVASEFGRGTTFQILIPALTESASEETASPECEGPHGGGELILVVDDEEPMRLISKRILETFGYRVVLACDGAEAVEIYTQRGAEIAAVVTDMTMPVMEGPEVIRILRTLNPKLPIMGASGLASTTYAAQLARLGVQHILSKPYLSADLLRMVKQILKEADPMDEAKREPRGSP